MREIFYFNKMKIILLVRGVKRSVLINKYI